MINARRVDSVKAKLHCCVPPSCLFAKLLLKGLKCFLWAHFCLSALWKLSGIASILGEGASLLCPNLSFVLNIQSIAPRKPPRFQIKIRTLPYNVSQQETRHNKHWLEWRCFCSSLNDICSIRLEFVIWTAAADVHVRHEGVFFVSTAPRSQRYEMSSSFRKTVSRLIRKLLNVLQAMFQSPAG